MLKRTTLVYALLGMLGPILWVVNPFPVGSAQYAIAYHVVLILWPADPFTMMDGSLGKVPALVMALGSNVVIFGMLGLLVGMTGAAPLLFSAAIVAGLLILWWAWLGAVEFSTIHLTAALISALLLMLPFLVPPFYFRRS
jgi:hypothetical protein